MPQLPRDEFDAIFGRVPRLTVEVLIRLPDGLVLTRRDIEPCVGRWHVPGGTVRFGEPLHDAVRRVAVDETGLEVEAEGLAGYIEYPKMHADGYPGWPVGIVFTTRVTGGSLRGSAQGAEIACHPAVPDDIIEEQGEFLRTWLAGQAGTLGAG